jgi:PqqD family protein of HPr-rel-A system
MSGACIITLPKNRLIRCRFWDNECVLYNQLTGETHLIDDMGTEIFRLISEKTATRTQLLQSLHSVFEWDIDFDVEEVLDNLILQYQKLGLIVVTENTPA